MSCDFYNIKYRNISLYNNFLNFNIHFLNLSEYVGTNYDKICTVQINPLPRYTVKNSTLSLRCD